MINFSAYTPFNVWYYCSSWISELEPVYVRKYVRDKYDPKVGEMDLLHANQNHAVVRCPESREVTVSAEMLLPQHQHLTMET